MERYTAGIIMSDYKEICLLKKFIKKFSEKIFIIIEARKMTDNFVFEKQIKPDILFLETIIDGKNAFSFLNAYKDITSNIVLISENTFFAIPAIKYQVSDFITKPFHEKQITRSLKHVISKLKNKATQQITLQNLNSSKQQPIYLPIKQISKIDILLIENIIYCEAKGKYTIFHHINGKRYQSNKTLKIYEKLLEKNPFFRIHRKYLVNLNMITKIDTTKRNNCKLLNGEILPISIRKIVAIITHINLLNE